jgi:tetratricopeptide (TPR) repeat protein
MHAGDESTLKLMSVSREAIPGALSKAESYRFLNQPWQAESICRDVLAIDPTNQAALVLLVLSLTDQFDQGVSAKAAIQVVENLHSEYHKAYYSGIVHEREAITLFRRRLSHSSGGEVYKLFQKAMEWYRKAQAIRPANDDDAVLRWNSCIRFLKRNWDFK